MYQRASDMFVEYIGIPGCGKTFHAGQYKEQLLREGIGFLDISRKKMMPLWLKVFYKLADYGVYIIPKYKKQIAEYRVVCKYCLAEPKYIPFSLEYCIKDIVLASLLHDVFGGNKKVVINDEGQLQRVVFLSVQYGVPMENLLKVYNKYKRNEKIEYIQISIEDALQNIKKRNRHVCPMDELTDDMLIGYLDEFRKGCECCFSK